MAEWLDWANDCDPDVAYECEAEQWEWKALEAKPDEPEPEL